MAGGSGQTAKPAGSSNGKVVLTPRPANAPPEKITIVEQGWTNTPIGYPNPIDDWIKKNLNIDFQIIAVPGSDLITKATTMFASGDDPDMVHHMNDQKNTILMFYDQGVLCDDLTPYLDYMPTRKALMTPEVTIVCTKDGKIFGLPNVPTPSTGGWYVRKDWLANLGLSMPKTETECLDMLRAFTNNDPSGTGMKTFGITEAAANTGFRYMNFIGDFFGERGYIISNNQVVHDILNGNRKKTLDFIRTVVNEQLINSDWLTVGVEDRKAQLYAGAYGMIYYPPGLVNDCEQAYKNDGSTLGWWEPMPWSDWSGNGTGGKGDPAVLTPALLGISKKAAADPEKMERICALIETCTYPNSGYWPLRYCQDLGEGYTYLLIPIDGGGYFFSNGLDIGGPWHWKANNGGVNDYGSWIGTSADLTIGGTSVTVPPAVGLQIANTKIMSDAPRYKGEQQLLNLDQQTLNDLKTFTDTFEMNYILGIDNNWDGYVSQWRRMGGDQLIADATAQFKALGLIK